MRFLHAIFEEFKELSAGVHKLPKKVCWYPKTIVTDMFLALLVKDLF